MEGADEGLAMPVGIVAPLALADAVAAPVPIRVLTVRAFPTQLQELFDVGRMQARIGGQNECSHAGDMGSRHARAVGVLVCATLPGRVDLYARRGHIDD